MDETSIVEILTFQNDVIQFLYGNAFIVLLLPHWIESRPKAAAKKRPLSLFRVNTLQSKLFTAQAGIPGDDRLGGLVPIPDYHDAQASLLGDLT